MKIGIDARFYQESGVGRYIRNLIANLQRIDVKNDYYIFLQQKDFNEFKTSNNFQKIKANFAWYGFAEQFKFPNLLDKLKLDLAHFPHFNVPIFLNKKFVVTIHDLIHQHYAMSRATTLNPINYQIKRWGYNKVFKTAVKKSEKILVPSDYVKELLINEWKVEKEKIVVTYEAVDQKIVASAEQINKKQMEIILNRLGVRSPYLFYVGNAHPHKNVEGLIKAFLNIRKNNQYLQLVLSGQDHYFWKRVKNEYQHKDIIYTGEVSDEQLVSLYKNAKCFVMPSFEEGFGIPILEAMALDCPVISSFTGSLREVGGSASLYFDPKNQQEIIETISSFLNNENLSKKLIQKGRERVKLFSWDKLAKQTLEVYQNASSYSS